MGYADVEDGEKEASVAIRAKHRDGGAETREERKEREGEGNAERR